MDTENSSHSYTYAISTAVFLAILFLTYSAYICKLTWLASNDPASSHSHTVNETSASVDEATLLACPKFLFSDINQFIDGGSTVSSCSICLGNYAATDVIQLLPNCRHMFHVKCVDEWIRVHPTCPVCRSSLVGDPLVEETPLSNV